MLHGRRKLVAVASKTLKLGSMPGRPRNSVSYLTSGCAAAICHNIVSIREMHLALSLTLSFSLCVAGLHENDLVKCALISDVLNLKSVHVTPVSAKDWEIIVSIFSACVCVCVSDTCACVSGNACVLLWPDKNSFISD